MKVMAEYNHDSTNFDTIEMAIGERDTVEPLEGWVAVYRDTVDGKKVIWARFEKIGRHVWIRDGNGVRKVRAVFQ